MFVDDYDGDTGERSPAGRSCNYGCLAAHVDEEGLAAGTTCRLDAAW